MLHFVWYVNYFSSFLAFLALFFLVPFKISCDGCKQKSSLCYWGHACSLGIYLVGSGCVVSLAKLLKCFNWLESPDTGQDFGYRALGTLQNCPSLIAGQWSNISQFLLILVCFEWSCKELAECQAKLYIIFSAPNEKE